MASGDTSSIKTPQDQPVDAQRDKDKAAVHHNLLSDVYNFVATHKKETEAVAVTAVIGGATLALQHYMPAPVAERITASGASILERTLGIAKAPNAVLEMKILDAPEKVESLIAKLRRNEVTSDILKVADPKSGAEIKLLTGHSPIAPEATTGADRIATCDLPAGCESKGIFAAQKGPVYLNFDKARQTLSFSETAEPFTQRLGRFLHGDTEAWVPLGTQPSSDLRALRADRAMMPNLENVNVAARAQAANPAKEVVARWESQQRLADVNSGTQGRVTKFIRSQVLPELQKSGQISKDWKFIQTQMHSASDGAGADAIFVNEATGQAHLIDFSSLPAKRIRPFGEAGNVRRAGISDRPPSDNSFDFSENWAEKARPNSTESFAGQDKSIPAIRTQGLIGFDPRWFDAMGGLDTEIPEAAMWKKDLADHLTDLTQAPAYFTAGKTPFASIVMTDAQTQVKQLEALKQWSLKEATQADSLNPDGYREYARSIDKTMGFLKANYTAVGDAKQFGTVVQQAADQTIFRWAVDKLGPSMVPEAQSAARGVTQPLSGVVQGEPNLRFVREKGIFSFKHDGLTYSSDPMTGQDGVLDRSRRNLLQQGRIKELLDDMNPKQKRILLARLGTAGKPASEETAIKQIGNVLIEHNNEIKAGGQLGMPRPGSTPPLIERIHRRVEMQTVSTLTRPMEIPGAAMRVDPKNPPRMQ
ncbi:MAG: hypothetical protein P4L53_18555 [Candidatus Obscuribacterales bacterium]|nr:hypothetical protein [Candidatus Obscuribacterales bacterium]